MRQSTITVYSGNDVAFRFQPREIDFYVIDVHHGTLYIELKDGTKHAFSPAWKWHVASTK